MKEAKRHRFAFEASRRALNRGRARYGKMMFFQLSRLVDVDERNDLLRACALKARSRGFYSEGTPVGQVAVGLINRAFHSLAGLNHSGQSAKPFYQWCQRAQFDRFNGRFHGLKIAKVG